MPKLKPKDAYQLFHDGALALADVEANGFRIDVPRLDAAIEKIDSQIKRNAKKLKEDEVWEEWKKEYGDRANMDSARQLGTVLFDKMDYESPGRTGKSNQHKTDEKTLESLDIPFVKRYLANKKLKKLKNTYLVGIKNELVGDRVHAVYNLNLAISYRSSCDSPNIQNQPKRNPKIAQMLRECFIASPGHHIMEADYGALEFKIAASFWRDKNLIAYASDPTKDVHRNMAMECYILGEDEWTKETRFYAKNQFVFPQLYGSSYAPCARNLWFEVVDAGLKTKQGMTVRKHLKERGIKTLGRCRSEDTPVPGTFEHHIKKVEDRFLGQFPQFAESKEEWWERYQRTGRFRLKTGFEIEGHFSRNQLMNIPIQGPAFHCLLWSLIRMNNWLKENGMRTKIIGTIHDSILFDVHDDELHDVMVKCKEVMEVDIRKAWDWIIVPLEVEFEVSPVNGNWWEIEEVKI